MPVAFADFVPFIDLALFGSIALLFFFFDDFGDLSFLLAFDFNDFVTLAGARVGRAGVGGVGVGGTGVGGVGVGGTGVGGVGVGGTGVGGVGVGGTGVGGVGVGGVGVGGTGDGGVGVGGKMRAIAAWTAANASTKPYPVL